MVMQIKLLVLFLLLTGDESKFSYRKPVVLVSRRSSQEGGGAHPPHLSP